MALLGNPASNAVPWPNWMFLQWAPEQDVKWPFVCGWKLEDLEAWPSPLGGDLEALFRVYAAPV